ncbi:hypothetical protein ACFYNO_07395 [Kitasatospora sp. NPDC006697]|uniref:hypothetical protein n=1 Tax=Kitasatospora sp. NPDC006697 TaxID=3364020 RepID=UPI0036BA5F30
MVTYQQLRDVNLSSLDALASDFEKLVRNWDLATAMADQLINPLEQSGWSGDAANAAGVVLTQTRGQIDLAFEEASALARALRDAHDQFDAAQKALRGVMDDASHQKLTIDDQGGISWRAAAAGSADAQNPAYDSQRQHQAQGIAARVSAVLQQATEADQAAAAALAADTGTSTAGFNASPLGGIQDQEAQQAAQLLSLGAGATDAQIAQLDQLLKEHNGDPRFTTAFYEKLGPQGFLTDWALMDQSGDYANSKARADALKDIQGNLGLSLANATDTRNVPHLSDAWEADLRKVGASHLQMVPGAPDASEPYGYQVLSNILRTGSYDAHFLDPIAEHVTQLTQANPSMWDAVLNNHPDSLTELGFLTTDGTGFNPMSGVLEALGHSPDAATHYFHDQATLYNPDGTVKGPADPSFKYVDLLTNEGPGSLGNGSYSVLMDRNTTGDQFPENGLPSSGETLALGHALQAATVGLAWDSTDAPLPQHTDEMNAVMADVVNKFGGGDGPKLIAGDGALFGNMNDSLGNMTAAYMGDVQSAVSNTQMPGLGEHLAPLDQTATEKLVGTLGRDPGAYATIAQAQQAYTTAQVQDVMAHPDQHPDLTTALDDAVHPGGMVQGLVSSGRASETLLNQQTSDAAYNAKIDQRAQWAQKIWEVTGGKKVGDVPGGGYLNNKVDQIIQNTADAYKVDTSGQSTDRATALMNSGAKSSASGAVLTAGAGMGLSRSYLTDLANHATLTGSDGFAAGYAIFHGGKDL